MTIAVAPARLDSPSEAGRIEAYLDGRDGATPMAWNPTRNGSTI